MQRIEARLGKPIEAILTDLYIDRGLTVREVGEELDVTGGVISEWLARWGIPARKNGQKASAA
jgi:hypothetical protein